MGRLIYGMSVSLDGFVETPSRSLDWVQVDEELHSFFGGGTRFFPDMADRIDVELLETRTFGSGVVYLRYEATNRR
jgi:hypothetical protein